MEEDASLLSEAAPRPGPRRTPLALALSLIAVGAVVGVRRARSSAAPRAFVRGGGGGGAALAREASGHDDDDSEYAFSYGDVEETWRLISEVNGDSDTAVECPTAPYALCNIAMCTLNDDGRTASCGCQKMSASQGNPAQVGLGAAGVLARSSEYRKLLKKCAEESDDDGDGGSCDVQDHADAFCREVENNNLYPSSMGVDYVSFYGVNPLYSERYGKYGGKTEGLSDDMTSVVCEGETMNAVCQGAPCYEREYDAPVFDLTCVCPVAATSTDLQLLESRGDGYGCTEINADDRRSCAASSTMDSLTLYPDADALAETIAAIEDAEPAGDKGRCPTVGSRLPFYTGERKSVDDDAPYSHDDDAGAAAHWQDDRQDDATRGSWHGRR